MFGRWLQRAREWITPLFMGTAMLRHIQGDPAAALACAEEAFRHYWRLRDDEGIAEAASLAGNAALALLKPRLALRYARVALRFSRRSGNLDALGAAVTLLGHVRARQGDYERALIAHRKALALAEEQGDPQDIAISMVTLGQTLGGMGKYAQAVDYIKQALVRVPERNFINDLFFSRAQNLLGGFYMFLGESERGEEAFRCAHERAAEIGDELGKWASSLHFDNAQIVQQHSLDGVEQLIEQKADVVSPFRDPRSEHLALMNQAQLLALCGEDAEPLRLLEQALALARRLRYRHGELQALVGMGSIRQVTGDLGAAEQLFEKAVRLAREINSHADAAELEGRRARIAIASGDLHAAVARLEEAIRGTETVRNDLRPAQDFEISIFERHVEAYHDLQWVLVNLGETDRALEIAERGRARALQGVLAARLDRGGAEPMDMARIRATAAEQQTTFVVYSLIIDPRDLAGDEPPELFVWVVPANPHAPIAFHRSGAPLRLAVDAAPGGGTHGTEEHFVRGSDPTLIEHELRIMDELLIAPVASRLPQNENDLVTFVPEGSLLVVPFAALQDREGRHVIERHTISVSPSIQTRITAVCQRQRLEQSKRRGALVVGNPDRTLVSAGREAAAVAESLKVANLEVELLLGNSATKAAVMSSIQHRKVLHFATHGEFDAKSQRLPGLLKLAPTAGEDGCWHAEEIASIELHADLVVLSACVTGQGRIAAEGLLGLSRAFLIAGAPAVIASLWEIPDSSTAGLMTRFYDAVGPAFRSPARALRQAMLATMRSHPEPHEWAGFVLIGSA